MATRTLGGILAAATLAVGISAGAAQAAPKCGNDASGFNSWKSEFQKVAVANGHGKRALAALEGTRYNTATIKADRGQKSFKLSLEQFMQRRGAAQIVQRGKQLKRQNAQLFDSIERRYGVSPGVLLAIWGMETGFGGFLGNQNIVSAVATLAYDCRRSEFFTRQLNAALQLVERGSLRPDAIGAAHGEIGQTQFLPSPYIKYAVDFDGDGRRDLVNSVPDILASTANFLRGHGWQRGGSWEPGSANYRVIRDWNRAEVYQRTISVMATRLKSGS